MDSFALLDSTFVGCGGISIQNAALPSAEASESRYRQNQNQEAPATKTKMARRPADVLELHGFPICTHCQDVYVPRSIFLFFSKKITKSHNHLNISFLSQTVTNELASWDDVHTLTAKNKQLLLDSQEDPLDALRQQRTSTKNRFNSKHPPFNPQEIQKRENLRDKQINPSKYKAMQKAYLLDKEGVDQRRRDRYMQFFVEKDEQAKLLAAQQALVEAQ